MWNLDILTSKLKELGCTIHIETSGAYPMSGQMDWITLSPKKTGLPKEEIYQKLMSLKSLFSIITILNLLKNRLQKFRKTATLSSERMEQKR
jgi:organic radical activating enzyme